MGRYRIWPDPAGSYAHLPHIPRNGAFAGRKSHFPELCRDLRGPVNTFAVIVDFLDGFYDLIFMQAAFAWLSL